MQLKSILNRVEKHRSFVYTSIRMVEQAEGPILEVGVRPRVNSRPTCSSCQRLGAGYDTLEERRFEFVPLWGIQVFLINAMRRVDCRTCGVRVETVPWAEGKHHLTKTYGWFLAGWAKRMSWTDVADAALGCAWRTGHSIESDLDRCLFGGDTVVDIENIFAVLDATAALHRFESDRPRFGGEHIGA